MASPSQAPILVWFRRDLRLHDNPALFEAAKTGTVIPVFIKDDKAAGKWALGGASTWWLHHSLEELQKDLAAKGIDLILREGDSLTVLKNLLKETGAETVHWNRRYEPWAVKQDSAIKEQLKEDGFAVHSFNAHLLCEPWEIKNGSGNPYKVFTPFWKACMNFLHSKPFHPPFALPKLKGVDKKIASDDLKKWQLLPTKPDWAKGFNAWQPGEKGAQKAFKDFLKKGIEIYKSQRDYPSIDATSQLSPHLAFGEISPRQLVFAVRHAIDSGDIDPRNVSQAEHFITEIGWREFAYHLLFHFPHTTDKPLNEKFSNFPWEHDPKGLRAWHKGQTGYPLIDAGLRQLWQTGWMHNRVRMIVGSFLVKNLLLPWQDGAHWFWDTLVDADLASNTLGWQWVGGCGADAAPYFRIFNPITQSERFDVKGTYIREFVPELKNLPDEFIHAPWLAPPLVLKEAGITLGKDYPLPLMDHAFARNRALAALKATRD